MKKKIIIDTDIGDDIDDAFALALAAEIEEAELVGITTVFKNSPLRAKQAKSLMSAAGNETNVYIGERLPLLGKIISFNFEGSEDPVNITPCQYDEGMSGATVSEISAVDAIIALSKEYSGELIVVTIGPMTNLAAAIKKAPCITSDIAAVYFMGGSFYSQIPEWNILCDPEAADIVLKSGIPCRAIGLDVTMKCTLEPDLLDDFKKSDKEVNRLLVTWLDRWQKHFNFEKSVMHDPLAVCSLFYDVCVFEDLYVKVILDGHLRGAFEVSKAKKEGFVPLSVAYSVDKNAFYEIVRQKLL